MKRTAVGVLIFIALSLHPGAQAGSTFAGVWALNRSVSDIPREIGFNVTLPPGAGGGQSGSGGYSGGGGRGRRGGGGGGYRGGPEPYMTRESPDEAKRAQLLNAEARNPPARVTIVDEPAAVTLTNELGQSRTLHPDGRDDTVDVQGVPLPVTAKRDGDRLVVTYRASPDREVRYTYARSANPQQIVVDVEFIQRGNNDRAHLVYEPPGATTTDAARPNAAPAQPGSAASSGSSAPATPHETFDATPGAELKGLTALGVLVEDLSSQAVACGLNRDTLEASLSKKFTDAGFSVRRNSDEDTYVYVNVMTTRLSDGGCLSRYDAFLYTHATANLTYRDRPVLVQVSLMHRGGIGNSAATAHPAAISRALEGYADLFVTQIRAANK